jgi:hypothetical protein
MTALTDAIRAKGHWRIVVRPAVYVPDRIPYASLRQTVERAVVQLRGWDFPHLERQGGDRHGNDWVGGETDWSYYKEAWRLSVSGQFVYLVGIHEDWVEDFQGFAGHRMPTDGTWLGVGDTLFRLTETFEFAARLAMTEAGAERVSVEVAIRGGEGRRLWVDSPTRMPMDNQYVFDEPELTYRKEVDRSELVARSRELAVEAAADVFAKFGWHPERSLLKDQQDELRSGQGG